MRTRVLLLATGVVALSVVYGCSKKSKGGGGVSISLNPYGGFITLTISSGAGAEVNASFVSGITPEPASVSFPLAPGTCTVGTAGTVLFTGNATPVSLGTNLNFTSGSAVISAALNTVDADTYLGETTSAVPGSSTWSIANTGASYLAAETMGTMATPGFIELTGTPTVTAGQALTLNWTGAAGANDIEINLSGGTPAKSAACSVPNTGSFTIPSSVTGAVGSGAEIAIEAGLITSLAIEGREVLVIGVAAPSSP